MEESVPVEVDDVVVMLLGAPGAAPGRVEGITRLEKLVFLFERESALSELVQESADYKAYLYGPFSRKVYQAVDSLSSAGLVVETTVSSEAVDEAAESEAAIGDESGNDFTARSFELTDDGWDYYRSLLEELPDAAEADLSGFKASYERLPLRRLLRYVYESYPEYTTESVIRDDVLAG